MTLTELDQKVYKLVIWLALLRSDSQLSCIRVSNRK